MAYKYRLRFETEGDPKTYVMFIEDGKLVINDVMTMDSIEHAKMMIELFAQVQNHMAGHKHIKFLVDKII